ncbi:type II toxin-antitoxin system PemK/MazF family toxin [Lactobacillus sp. ESL0791]|uniref:type II toxin-antitoxin system PemK/MazF family toxin n=1 Tax=Lactobacillus sp. ESL0791 TaxID=2983234 RepID=UPI0035AB6E72
MSKNQNTNNNNYPNQGDIIIVDAEPHIGKEYGGHNPRANNIRRHMVVISNTAYNRQTGMFVGMPITTSEKYKNNQHYKPILLVDAKNGVKGFVCLWQIQNFDFLKRNGKIVNHVQKPYLKDLLNYVNAITELDF